MRFHMLGLGYIPTKKKHSYCAFTHRCIRLANILKRYLGHEIIFYGVEDPELPCDEAVTIFTNSEYEQFYGHIDPEHQQIPCDMESDAYRLFCERTVEEVGKRKQKNDFLLAMVGYYHKPICDPHMGDMIVVEPGIGYGGCFAPFKVFETYAWMHYVYGRLGVENGQYYDAVIPPAFDPDEFPFRDRHEKGDYALFMARIISRKGIMIALQAAHAMNIRLKVVGQGSLVNDDEGLAINPADFPLAEFYQRAVGPEERAELMSRAAVFIAPTIYIEPNGNVAVEAAMCGTPVVTTDWGGFTDNVLHGITGWRCRTFDDFCWALRHCGDIDPKVCREWAIENYSEAAVAPKYEEYFQRLYSLYTSEHGWYELTHDRPPITWLKKHYPCIVHSRSGVHPEKVTLTGTFTGWFIPNET